jgi:peptidoglycan-associated lipoprotein
MMSPARWLVVLTVAASLGAAACSKKAPVVQPAAPPPPSDATSPPSAVRPPAPVGVADPAVAPPPVVREDPIASASLDDLNRNSPLKPAFFDLNSSELNADGQKALDENASVLKRFPAWTITIEGHCDERGSPEYNLALGERRSVAARTYLVSLGIAADRLRVVSYGKEFPFDPGHTEAAFAKNRRAHFVITAK